MITVREATPEDNAALRALSRATSMRGLIGLRIEREPDFFTLFRLRGDGPVMVALIDGRLVGSFSAASRWVYVEGAPRRVHYIGDLKVHPDLQGRGLVLRLMQTLYQRLLGQGADLVFCVVSGGNTPVFGLMKGRFGLPIFESVGQFFVYEILSSSRRWRSPYQIERAAEADLPALHRLVDTFNKAYQFAPVLSEQEWQRYGQMAEPEGPLQMLVARKDGAVRATLCALDTTFAKQHIVTSLPGPLRAAVTVSRSVGRIAPIVPFPKPGEPISMLFLQHPAIEEGHEAALRALIQHVRNQAFRQRYPFVVIGLHERDPLRSVFRRLPRFTFHSHGFVSSLRHDRALLEQICSGVPMEDYALV